jgi:prefoldin beta subunit
MSAKPEQEKIQQLQLLEQANQNLLMQKQNFQSQLLETESAIEELGKSSKSYKIVGSIMVASDSKSLKDEMAKRKEMLDLRIAAIEKQESQLRERASKLQSEVLQGMKGEHNHKHGDDCECGDDCKCEK